MLALALALTAVSLLFLVASPYAGWLMTLFAKPLIDTAWSAEHMILGLRPVEMIGAGLPALVMLRLALFRKARPATMELGWAWGFYLVTVLLGAAMYLGEGDPLGTVSFLLRALNGAVAFYGFQATFNTRERFRVLLIVLLVAGIFPMATGFYEAVTGHHWQIRLGVGEQIRVAGLYHNSTNLRYFGYATLAAIALYWGYFLRRGYLLKVLLVAYAVVCAVVMFRIYSKAAFGTLAIAGLAWILVRRKVVWPVLVAVAIVVANAAYEGAVVEEVSTTFYHETEVLSGSQSEDFLFASRVGGWKVLVENWSKEDFIAKLIGSGGGGGRMARAGGHNDYVRALIQTGVLGLAAYIALLVSAGWVLARRTMSKRTPLNVMACIFLFAWLVDSLGLTPAVYTHFQWYVWGFIGLALGGVRGLDNEKSANQAPGLRTDSKRRNHGSANSCKSAT